MTNKRKYKRLGSTQLTPEIDIDLEQRISDVELGFKKNIMNKETIQAIYDVEQDKNLTHYESSDDMFMDLGI